MEKCIEFSNDKFDNSIPISYFDIFVARNRSGMNDKIVLELNLKKRNWLDSSTDFRS